jgi:hypothetical protein
MNCSRLSKKHMSFRAVTIFAILLLVLIFQLISNSRTNERFYQSEINRSADEKSIKEDSELSTPEKSIVFNEGNDKYLTQLQNKEIQLASKQADTLAQVPVIKWQNDLVANVRSEDINQTIKNLPNFDDTTMAGSSLSMEYAPSDPSARNLYVTRLARVRKLYAIGKENPQLVIPLLRKVHSGSIAQWPEADKESDEIYRKGIRSSSEPQASDRCLNYCVAATYLLAELADYDSLPLLSRQYKIHDPFPPDYRGAPVPPATTFYAMHRLVSTYPREKLSAEAVKALDEYLDAAKELVPPPKLIKVTVWDSYYVESDPRVAVLGLQEEILQTQKTMTMPLYPVKFKFEDNWGVQDENGEINLGMLSTVWKKLSDSERLELQEKIRSSDMETPLFRQTEKLNALFNKLDAFVRIVYPSQ